MKLRNRILSAIMVVVMCMSFATISAFAADGAISAQASASKVKVGDTFTVDVNVDTNPGHVMLFFNLTYNQDVVALTGATDAKLYANGTLAKDYTRYPYVLSWQNEAADDNLTETGKIVTLTFTAKAAGEANIVVASDVTNTMNFDIDNVDFGTATAAVTVEADAPAKEDVVIDDVNDFDYTDVYVEDGVEKKHAAFEVAFTVAENNNPVTALNVTGTKTAKVALKTAVTSGTCNVFINVLGVPADATLGTITVAPVAE